MHCLVGSSVKGGEDSGVGHADPFHDGSRPDVVVIGARHDGLPAEGVEGVGKSGLPYLGRVAVAPELSSEGPANLNPVGITSSLLGPRHVSLTHASAGRNALIRSQSSSEGAGERPPRPISSPVWRP